MCSCINRNTFCHKKAGRYLRTKEEFFKSYLYLFSWTARDYFGFCSYMGFHLRLGSNRIGVTIELLMK